MSRKRKPSPWVLPKFDDLHSIIPIGRKYAHGTPIWVFSANWKLAREIVNALNEREKHERL